MSARTYLGNHIVTGEIERANGVASWQPGELAQDDDERRVWRFIKTHQAQPVSLHSDSGARTLRRQPPNDGRRAGPQSVDVVPGGHDWPAWRQLWDNFLETHFMACGQPLAGSPKREPARVRRAARREEPRALLRAMTQFPPGRRWKPTLAIKHRQRYTSVRQPR